MLLGTGSLVMGLVEPQRAGLQSGFIASTVGITAVVLGVRVVKNARWGSSSARAFGRGGAILGAVGTALMAYAVIAVALIGVGVHLPAISLPISDRGQAMSAVLPSTNASAAVTDATTVPTPPVPAQHVSVPQTATGAAPATPEAERSAVVQSAGTLAFVMEQSFGGGPYPETLAVGMSSPLRIMLTDGTGLAAVPDGSRVLYSTSSDRSAWSVTIIGARFGAVATYSSAVGTVEAG